MDIQNINDIGTFLDTDEKCINFLINTRWPSGAHCPKCGHDKVYKLNTFQLKCANNKCYLKFSVTYNTLLSDTNIDFKKWFKYIFLYAKSNGRILPVNSGDKLTQITSFYLGEKLKIIFDTIDTNLSAPIKFITAVNNIFSPNYHKDIFNRKQYKKGYIIPTEIIDFNKSSDYVRIIRFINITIHYHLFRGWISIKFCDAQDVFSELIIDIADSNIKIDITGSFIITMVRKKLNKMWLEYVRSHPNLKKWHESYHRQYKKMVSSQLKTSYVKSLLKDGTPPSRENIDIKRREIKEKRRKNNSYILHDEDL